MLMLAAVLTVTGVWASAGGVAAASPNKVVPVPSPSVVVSDGGLHLTAAQQAKVNQVLGFISEKGMWGEFALTADGTLTTVDPLGVIKSEYTLSGDQVKTIQGILTYAKQNKAATTAPKTGVVQPNVFLSGTVIYFTYSDMVALLFTAATMGTPALAAAINALAWILGGPFGGVVGIIMTVFGLGSLGALAWTILQAHVLHQGVYFGVTWNWIFPNPAMGTWCGCN